MAPRSTHAAKRVALGLLLAAHVAGSAPTGGGPGTAHAQEAPVILNATESASNGDLFQLQGHAFGSAPEVWLARIPDTSTPLEPDFEADTLIASPRGYATARMPAMESPDLMAVFVKNGSSTSAPRFINRARVNHVEHEAVGPGQSLRLWGRNLKLSAGTPAVEFVNGSTRLSATVTAASETELAVTAPNVTTGTVYELHVTNGLGGDHGKAIAEETITGRSAGPDPFTLGVPWGSDFTYSGTVRNLSGSCTRAAIQSLIDASTAAGGVVQLPPGTCTLDGELLLKSNVILRGGGRTQTTLSRSSGRVVRFATGARLAGIRDLTLAGGASPLYAGGRGFNPSLHESDDSGPDRMFLKDVGITANPGSSDVGAELYDFRNVLFDGVTFTTTTGHLRRPLTAMRGRHLTLRGGSWTWEDERIIIEDGHHVVIDGVTFQKEYGLPNGPGAGSFFDRGILAMDVTEQVAILGSTFDANGTTAQLTQQNDTESIITQAYSKNRTHWQGTATGGSSTTLIDSGKTFNPPNSRYYAMLIDGQGAGQVRKVASTSGGTVTVTPAWDVPPASGTKYIVNHIDARAWLVRGNTLTDNSRGIWVYSGGVDWQIVANQFTNNQGINVRAHQRYDGQLQHWPAWNFDVRDNVIRNTVAPKDEATAFVGFYLHQSDRADLSGTYVLQVRAKGNTVDAHTNEPFQSPTWTDGVWLAVNLEGPGGGCNDCTSRDEDTPGLMNAISEGNAIGDTTRAHQTGTGAFNVAIACPSYTNVVTQVSNRLGPGESVGAVDLVAVGCDVPPPTDTPTPTLTPTPGVPTDTPTPTATPLDTSTPTVTPTATDTQTPTPACSQWCVVRIELWNAQTNVKVRDLVEGDVIDYSVLGTTQIAFRAITNPDSQAGAGSVRFFLNGTMDQNENAWPWFSEGDCWGCSPPDVTPEAPQLNGAYTLGARAFSGASGGGTAGPLKQYSITVQQ